MSAAPSITPPAPELCHGEGIEYKAFSRSILYLVATCSYPTTGFTIFFEREGEGFDKFRLMQQPPTGVFMNLVTYYIATWPTNSISAAALPDSTHVTIVDAYGEHQVHVKRETRE